MEAKKISLNPMDYTNRIVVEYKNKFMTEEVKQAIEDNYTKEYTNDRYILFHRNS